MAVDAAVPPSNYIINLQILHVRAGYEMEEYLRRMIDGRVHRRFPHQKKK